MTTLDVATGYQDLLGSVFSSAVAAKVWFATLAMALALIQIATAARMWGKIERFVPCSTRTAQRIHRWSGRLAVLATLPVVFHCVTILGFQTTDARVAIHSVVGSFVYGVLVAKLFAIRDHGFPRWVIPVLGGSMFAALAILWLTSGLWYFTEVRFGF